MLPVIRMLLLQRVISSHYENNEIWVGARPMSEDIFLISQRRQEIYLKTEKEGSKYKIIDGLYMLHLFNLVHQHREGRRHSAPTADDDETQPSSMAPKDTEQGYPKYDNYDAIEVAETAAIPPTTMG